MKNNAGFKVGDKVRYLTPTVGGVESLSDLLKLTNKEKELWKQQYRLLKEVML